MAAFLMAVVSAGLRGEGLPISGTLGGAAFDPWNRTKWAQWYDASGKLVKSFIVDTSVVFADGGAGSPYLWTPDCATNLGRIFEISADKDIVVDGRGTKIDITIPIMRGSIEDFYRNSARVGKADPVLNADTWIPKIGAFYVNQGAETNGAGSFIRNFEMKGFYRAIETNHAHRRRLTVEGCDMLRCMHAVFARGQNVTVRDCRLKETFNSGVYGEYSSRGWVFEDCDFGDNSVNALAQSYAGMVLDACYEYVIKGNTFAGPSVVDSLVPKHSTALSLYRNAGETGDIREHATHDIQIEGNTFEGYHLAVDIGARTGVVDEKDRSLEGRCYTNDILLKDNLFDECKIGIKINSDQNRMLNNRFTGCLRDIVIQCVFYKSLNQHITQTEGSAGVWLWSQPQDWSGFGDYCYYQASSGNRVFQGVPDAERLFHLDIKGSVTLNRPARVDFTARVVLEETLLIGESFQDMVASGALPIGIAVADYAAHIEGDEIAVIWDTPVSRIGSQDYYSIIIYDQWGLELDRCGRSAAKWKAIAGGNLIPGKGYIHVDSEAEVAAISEAADANGNYPVYIFMRGFALDEQNVTDKGVVRLMGSNRIPLQDVTVGDFVSGNGYLEVAVIPQPEQGAGAGKIYYLDPSVPSWIGESNGLIQPLKKIAAGKFDLTATGSQVAGVGGGESPIYLFKPGSAGGHYATVAGSTGEWAALAAGELDGKGENGDEIAVAANVGEEGVFPLRYFRVSSGLYDSYLGEELSVKPRALDAGKIVVGERLGVGERLKGDAIEGDIGAEVAKWGEHLALLPSAPKISGVPLFWLASGPGKRFPEIRSANDLLVYALAANYTVAEDGSFSTGGDLSYLPVVRIDEATQRLSMSFVPRRGGVIYCVQRSTDLVNWVNLDTPVTALGFNELHAVESPLLVDAVERQFLRLKISIDPESGLEAFGGVNGVLAAGIYPVGVLALHGGGREAEPVSDSSGVSVETAGAEAGMRSMTGGGRMHIRTVPLYR